LIAVDFKKIASLVFAFIITVMSVSCGNKQETSVSHTDVIVGIDAENKIKNTASTDLDDSFADIFTTTETSEPAETTTTTVSTTVITEDEDIYEETTTMQTGHKAPEMYGTRNTNVTESDTKTSQTDNSQTVSDSEIQVQNLQISAISVNCLKITWSPDPNDTDANREYEISYSTNAPYAENIHFIFPAPDTVYLTGLREGSAYDITVTPKMTAQDTKTMKSAYITGYTEKVEVIYDFNTEADKPYGDGSWTACFAGERASGLTGEPSRSGIYGSVIDPITDTTIRRDEYGDYCVAMGIWFGYVGDRFLITLENGIQFTVKICDSKGEGDETGKYHDFGSSGRCIIEFIYDNDSSLPSVVRTTGSWGGYNWNGLDLGANIESIQKINYGNTVNY